MNLNLSPFWAVVVLAVVTPVLTIGIAIALFLLAGDAMEI